LLILPVHSPGLIKEMIMKPRNQLWAVMAVLAPSAGMIVGRAHLIGPNPGTYFALGILATLSAVGIGYGVREGRRLARDGRRIEN
jgi:hypothetical protein